MSMLCPSDYRFGDESDPRSPHYEEVPTYFIVLPHNYEDEDGVVRRAELSFEYEIEYDDGCPDVVRPEFRGAMILGVSVGEKEAYDFLGEIPDGKELICLINEARDWENTAYIDVKAKNLKGEDVNAKLVASYTAFPSDSNEKSATKFEVRDVCPERSIRLDGGKEMRLHEFLREHPGVDLPGTDDLKAAIFQYHSAKYPEMFAEKPAPIISKRM
jgi:hypothetical protein